MKFLFYVYFIILHFLFFEVSQAAKILAIFPIPAKSHFNCNNAIMKSLADVGHEITIITSFPEDAAKVNYSKIIDVSKHMAVGVGKPALMDYVQLGTYKMMYNAYMLELPFCDKVFKMKEIQDMLKFNRKDYDVVFVEIMSLYKCFLPVAKKLGIPIIGTVTFKSWLYADKIINNPNNPAYVPSSMSPAFKFKDFYQTLLNIWDYFILEYYWYTILIPIYKQFHQDYLQQAISYSEFMSIEPDFLLYDNHPTFLPKANNPNLVEIGGIHIQPAKPLPQHIQKFIDEAKHGVILFSFGTVVRTSKIPLEMTRAFVEAFAQIPQRVIWKFEDQPADNLTIPDNLLLVDWLPQRDILEHKNVIAFISHCGQSGTYEAIYTATPVISCPLFGDQPGNAALLEQLEVAVHLDIYSITKDNVLSALNAIVNDTKYYNNMQKLSQTFKNRPMTPQQSVVYWTEYVIQYQGAPHLKPAASQLNFFQYFLLDILSFVILSFLVLFYIIYKIFVSFCIFFSKFQRNYEIVKNKSQ